MKSLRFLALLACATRFIEPVYVPKRKPDFVGLNERREKRRQHRQDKKRNRRGNP